MKTTEPPLAALRAKIDAVDHELLGLLARRTAIVGEIAKVKRGSGIRIRDFTREREVLDDRATRAKHMGLPPEEIEAIFRVVLRASRDFQASQQVEVPLDAAPLRVAVIGGRGAMGSCMARLFADLGHTVVVADPDTELRPIDAARAADIVLVSVPIDVTESVIHEIGPHVRPDGVLTDVTSIKQAPMRAMLEASRSAVVGIHPMFGPSVHSVQGQRVVICPGRGERWKSQLEQMFTARGLVVTVATPDEHDRAMAVVQVLNHFQTQVLGVTLSRFGVSLEESLKFTSPVYLIELYVAARHFAQSPSLYGAIEMTNPLTAEVTSAFQASADELAQVLRDRDATRFAEIFSEVRGFFGRFTDEAMEQSSYLIDRLVERS